MGIGYVSVRCIPCRCSECLIKLSSPFNRSQVIYNQDRYKGENHNCVYGPILGSYKNCQIIDFVESRTEHKSSDTDINIHIKLIYIRKISLNIGKDISDNNYVAISTINKNAEN